ncbi:bacteriohemerythrin [Uliginosibacterium sp. 31-16]|uniref:bacteriohemerythrin n=1 Tax=Uliginosibacterium sp. 31-16 TaxID=3068315 RepID=UPI00273E0CF8|nr:bacteriohemerythrin [Uliginosibacterium sp. 31-16]MDP5239961.1 bacteriohemerythrin [Uliginosibacterium sp. 31-16]
MRVMQWSEALSVGDVQIDADHRELFCLLDQLREAVRTGQSGPSPVEILSELVRCTEAHFRLEEQFMHRVRFADLSAHKAEHDKLLAQVRELHAKVAQGDLPLSLSVFGFLYGWLARHIEIKDKTLSVALKKSITD